MKTRPILDIQHATVYRGDTCVFSDFSFALHEGEHAAIVGPNGAGKSTLLKLLAGGVHPLPKDETRLSLFGEEGGNVWEVRKRLGIVSHDLQRDYLICAEGVNVILSGYYASNDTYEYQEFSEAQNARAREIMQELGIESLAGRRFGHLSTGEQRRFLLGRALVHDPSVLVLDEPTSGLDLKACFQYLDLLRAQIRKGKTVLLVTHHLHEIPPEIERVVKDYLHYRRDTQPLAMPSAGCVFKNPPNDSAGRLIEAVGLKGARVGDAEVSTKHANFMVNRGQARAADVIALIGKVRSAIRRRAGVRLDLELKIVGEA
ncbi:MAG: ATP-binding cassette domain-containing protein [Nitrospira sp.]|nr:ATP-binding cassette domain-containing protein [Nitrospira sp.]